MRAGEEGARGHKVAASHQSRTTYSRFGTVCQLQKGIRREFPVFLFFPGENFARFASQRPGLLSHRDTVQDYFLCTSEVRFPADGFGRLQKSGLRGGGRGLFCALRRLIRESHTSFPFHLSSSSSSFSVYVSVYHCARLSLPFSRELIGDGCSIGN